MKNRTVINIVIHKPTGAKIPIIIDEKNKNNIITKYHESLKDRKYFTIQMLSERWNKKEEECAELLKKYQIPGHLKASDMNSNKLPITAAIFFEEYIYSLEKKEKLKHNKLKSKSFN